MVDAAKVVLDVDVHHVIEASVGCHANGLQRLRGTPLRPESIGHRQEVRLEQGLHHKLGRHLNHPVPHRRNAQRPLPPVRLRNVPAPHRLRPILPGLEIVLDTQQKRLDPLLLNGGDRLAIHPRSPTIAPYPPPRFPQDVAPVDPVVQRVEAALPTPLGRSPQRPLEFSHFALRVVGACAHALALTPMRTRDQSRGPSLQAVLLPFAGTTTPSDSLPAPRRFGFTLSTWPRSDSSRRVGPLQFRTGPWTRAAPHTPEGSSAAPMSPRCLWPSPRHARLGSLCLSADNLTRRQDSRDVAARALAPSVEALDAPLSRGALTLRPGPATERIVAYSVAPRLEERAFQILGAGPGVVGMGRVTLDSGIRKQVVKVGLPREEHHQTSDLEQLAAALGVTPADVGLAVLQGLPGALRDDPAGVTVTTFAAAGGERVLAVERGDTAGMKFGLAVDIGTTSVVSTLIELESGEQLGSVSSLNPQAVFGGDLMSRIAFAQFAPGNLRKLHTRIVGLLNQHIEEICRQSGVLAKWIYKVVVVGNTCMHHLLLGIDPSYVGLAPYPPVMRHALVLPARELFLKVAPEARVCLLPLVAGFVGADAVAVALATRIYESAEIRIAVDIGTNGEVLLGSRDRLWACSAPAGPALEGAQIRHGMRGALGAIDRVTVDDDLHVHTIGEADALGICGSGLIDLVAGLLDAGVIDWTRLIHVESRAALPPTRAA